MDRNVGGWWALPPAARTHNFSQARPGPQDALLVGREISQKNKDNTVSLLMHRAYINPLTQ